jgi:hypothetical protein
LCFLAFISFYPVPFLCFSCAPLFSFPFLALRFTSVLSTSNTEDPPGCVCTHTHTHILYMHVYVCIYIYTYMHIYIYAYVHIYIYIYICMCVYMCVCVCSCVFTHTVLLVGLAHGLHIQYNT